jgi:crotonobetainyl-CoA:carnitine CoA-transferase CaiB-like acyl-CoA transferase
LAGGSWQALAGIFAALFQRERTGQGQWLDLAMADGVLSTLSLTLAIELAGFTAPGRGEGPLNGGLACYGIYETADGEHLSVGALEGHFFDRLVVAMDLPQLQGQGLAWGEQADEARALLVERFRQRSREEWCALLQPLGVCVEPILEAGQVAGHPQYLARDMFFELPGARGFLRQMANPLKLAGARTPTLAPPALGQHSRELLTELGLSPAHIQSLGDAGVIGLDSVE